MSCMVSLFVVFNHMKKNNKWLDLLYDFMFKMFDNWTSFQCSRQGNFLIQSRYVFMDLKNACNRVPRGILWEVCRTREQQACPPTEHGQNNRNNLQYNAIQYSKTINYGHKIIFLTCSQQKLKIIIGYCIISYYNLYMLLCPPPVCYFNVLEYIQNEL